MYFREIFFGQDAPVQRHISAGRIVILLIALLVGVAWHYGIITAAVLALKPILGGIWTMLSEMAAAIRDFLQFLLSRLSH